MRKSRIICFDGQIRTLTARKNCQSIFSKNLTIDHLGLITIVLGDYFSFPENFEEQFNDHESELNSTFKISLVPNKFYKLNFVEMLSYSASKITGIKIRKKIGERSKTELLGSSEKEFMDSDRYESFV